MNKKATKAFSFNLWEGSPKF